MKIVAISLFSVLAWLACEAMAQDVSSEYTPRQLETAERELFDSLDLPWYELELIVIERLSVLAFNAREQLIERRPRTIPYAALELLDEASNEDIGFSQTALWREEYDHCFGFPLFSERLEPHPLWSSAFGPEYIEPLEDNADPLGELESEASPSQVQTPVSTSTTASTSTSNPAPTPAPVPVPILTAEERAIAELRLALASFEQTLISRSLKPSAELTLETNVKLINRRRNLRPLLHTGWLQAAPDREQPQPIRVSYREGTLAEKLVGYVDLTRGRYLHLHVDLWYSTPGLGWLPQPVTATSLSPQYSTEVAQFMRLNESRRMRSSELHYLDHPKLGVIARAVPVKMPDHLVKEFLDLGRPKL